MLTTNFRREPCAGTREGAGEASGGFGLGRSGAHSRAAAADAS